MVTGRRAFRGNNAIALLTDIVSREPERLNAYDPSLPVDLDKIVHRALRKDPDRRFKNASDVRVALAELTDELESGDALMASDVRVARPTRKRWWLWAAPAVVLLATVATILSGGASDVPPMRLVPLTSYDGYEREPAISPDGRRLAFMKDGDIYVQLIGEGEAVPLTNADEGDASPDVVTGQRSHRVSTTP